jgi:single-strand DNA-binding protein
MAAGNETVIVGNITAEPELKFTPNGAAVANFSIAWNKRFKNANDEWDSTAHFIDVTVWRELAENCAESLQKGDRIMVIGHFEQQTWEDKDSGKNRSKLVLIADEVGPSLRWATTPDIVKNERDDNGGGSRGGGGGRGDDRGGRGGGRGRDDGGSRGRSSGGGGRRSPEPSFDDEEPF